jgi:hypothetical protein
LNEQISKHLRFCKATAAMLALLFGFVQKALDMLLREMELSRAFGDQDKLADTVADLACDKCALPLLVTEIANSILVE